MNLEESPRRKSVRLTALNENEGEEETRRKVNVPAEMRSKRNADRSSVIGVKKAKALVVTYSPSDDDFVENAFEPTKAATSKVQQHKPTKSKTSSKPKGSSKPSSSSKPVLSNDVDPSITLEQPESSYKRLLVKSCPSRFNKIIKTLTNHQKQAVRNLGFGSILEFNISKMPSRLGYWLLERFDAETATLNVLNKSIQVTSELVHQTFGVPMGILEVHSYDLVKERSNPVYIEWKKQFDISRIYPKHLAAVMNKQIKRNDCGRTFQMNFLVFFVTILARMISLGTVNPSFIPSLNLKDVQNMNWCQFIVNSLITVKKEWKGGRFYGPVLMLELIFANSILKMVSIRVPAFKYWNTDLIVELDNKMFVNDTKISVKEEHDDDDEENGGVANDAEENVVEDDAEKNEGMGNVAEVNEHKDVEVPSKKPRFTKKIIKQLRTPEKDVEQQKDSQRIEVMLEDEQIVIKDLRTPRKKKDKVVPEEDIEDAGGKDDEQGRGKEVEIENNDGNRTIQEVEIENNDGKILTIEEEGATLVGKKRKRKTKSVKKNVREGEVAKKITNEDQGVDDAIHTGEDISNVHIDDFAEQQSVHIDNIGEKPCLDEEMTDAGVQLTETDESDEIGNPLTGTAETVETGSDEQNRLSSDSFKLTQQLTQQLSDMIFEFQGEYSQFKSAEEFDRSLRNLLTVFQELKIEIDDMLRAALEKYPRDKALLEVRDWMNKLVNRMRSNSSQSEDDNSKPALLTYVDNKDEEAAHRHDDNCEAQEAMKKTDEQPQEDLQPDERTLSQMFLDPEFVKDYMKIERQNAQMQKPEFPLFSTVELEQKKCWEMVMYQKKQPDEVLDELIKKLSFLNPLSYNLSAQKLGDEAWKKIVKDALELRASALESENFSTPETRPKMIKPISCVAVTPEQKLKIALLSSFNTIATKMKIPAAKEKMQKAEEKGLENKKEKRKGKLTEALKSPYLQRVVVMKNKTTEHEKKVAEAIFSARGSIDDILFKSYFVDAMRLHFESMKFGNEIISAVIDVWAYLLNQGEHKRGPNSLRKLFCTTSVITKNMLKMHIRRKELYTMFEKTMEHFLFLSVHPTIRDIDLVFFPLMLDDEHYYLVCFNLKDPQVHILDNMDHNATVKDRYGKTLTYLKTLFLRFLNERDHPSENRLKDYNICNVQMRWRTKDNVIDCGIFVMRHMETYQGTMANYDAGFTVEGKEQDEQIMNLRKKYLTKILISEENELREDVEKEIHEYQCLDLKTKKELQQNSDRAIAERSSEYFDLQLANMGITSCP